MDLKPPIVDTFRSLEARIALVSAWINLHYRVDGPIAKMSRYSWLLVYKSHIEGAGRGQRHEAYCCQRGDIFT